MTARWKPFIDGELRYLQEVLERHMSKDTGAKALWDEIEEERKRREERRWEAQS